VKLTRAFVKEAIQQNHKARRTCAHRLKPPPDADAAQLCAIKKAETGSLGGQTTLTGRVGGRKPPQGGNGVVGEELNTLS